MASVIDASVALGLGLVLAPSLGLYFSRRAVVALQMDSPASLWKGPIPLILGVFGKLVYLLPLMLVVVLLVEPLFRRSIGKAVTGQRLCASDGAPPSARASWWRFAFKAGPACIAVLGFVVGSWELLVLACLLSVVVAIAFAPVLFGRAALYDRWVGTDVSLTEA